LRNITRVTNDNGYLTLSLLALDYPRQNAPSFSQTDGSEVESWREGWEALLKPCKDRISGPSKSSEGAYDNEYNEAFHEVGRPILVTPLLYLV
jgi:hypothetical protein